MFSTTMLPWCTSIVYVCSVRIFISCKIVISTLIWWFRLASFEISPWYAYFLMQRVNKMKFHRNKSFCYEGKCSFYLNLKNDNSAKAKQQKLQMIASFLRGLTLFWENLESN